MRLLDLFCGAGGAAMGYSRAGFTEIVGVDLVNQPRYPFTFVQADAMTYTLDGFDAIHASPPCQGYSIMRNLPWLRGKEYPLLIEPTVERLRTWGAPWVVENVMGAKLDAGWLCGSMFGLPIYRHRYFMTSFLWFPPPHRKHEEVIKSGRHIGNRAAVPVRKTGHKYGFDRTDAGVGHGNTAGSAREALGVPWMRRDEASQAIPPAYTEFIGKQLIRFIERKAS